MEGLLPCPFCGNKDLKVEVLQNKEDMFTNAIIMSVDIVCDKCRTLKNIQVVRENEEECKKEIIKEYNRRFLNGKMLQFE